MDSLLRKLHQIYDEMRKVAMPSNVSMHIDALETLLIKKKHHKTMKNLTQLEEAMTKKQERYLSWATRDNYFGDWTESMRRDSQKIQQIKRTLQSLDTLDC